MMDFIKKSFREELLEYEGKQYNIQKEELDKGIILVKFIKNNFTLKITFENKPNIKIKQNIKTSLKNFIKYFLFSENFFYKRNNIEYKFKDLDSFIKQVEYMKNFKADKEQIYTYLKFLLFITDTEKEEIKILLNSNSFKFLIKPQSEVEYKNLIFNLFSYRSYKDFFFFLSLNNFILFGRSKDTLEKFLCLKLEDHLEMLSDAIDKQGFLRIDFDFYKNKTFYTYFLIQDLLFKEKEFLEFFKTVSLNNFLKSINIFEILNHDLEKDLFLKLYRFIIKENLILEDVFYFSNREKNSLKSMLLKILQVRNKESLNLSNNKIETYKSKIINLVKDKEVLYHLNLFIYLYAFHKIDLDKLLEILSQIYNLELDRMSEPNFILEYINYFLNNSIDNDFLSPKIYYLLQTR